MGPFAHRKASLALAGDELLQGTGGRKAGPGNRICGVSFLLHSPASPEPSSHFCHWAMAVTPALGWHSPSQRPLPGVGSGAEQSPAAAPSGSGGHETCMEPKCPAHCGARKAARLGHVRQERCCGVPAAPWTGAGSWAGHMGRGHGQLSFPFHTLQGLCEAGAKTRSPAGVHGRFKPLLTPQVTFSRGEARDPSCCSPLASGRARPCQPRPSSLSSPSSCPPEQTLNNHITPHLHCTEAKV